LQAFLFALYEEIETPDTGGKTKYESGKYMTGFGFLPAAPE
jgi:hypothetical protein